MFGPRLLTLAEHGQDSTRPCDQHVMLNAGEAQMTARGKMRRVLFFTDSCTGLFC